MPKYSTSLVPGEAQGGEKLWGLIVHLHERQTQEDRQTAARTHEHLQPLGLPEPGARVWLLQPLWKEFGHFLER